MSSSSDSDNPFGAESSENNEQEERLNANELPP